MKLFLTLFLCAFVFSCKPRRPSSSAKDASSDLDSCQNYDIASELGAEYDFQVYSSPIHFGSNTPFNEINLLKAKNPISKQYDLEKEFYFTSNYDFQAYFLPATKDLIITKMLTADDFPATKGTATLYQEKINDYKPGDKVQIEIDPLASYNKSIFFRYGSNVFRYRVEFQKKGSLDVVTKENFSPDSKIDDSATMAVVPRSFAKGYDAGFDVVFLTPESNRSLLRVRRSNEADNPRQFEYAMPAMPPGSLLKSIAYTNTEVAQDLPASSAVQYLMVFGSENSEYYRRIIRTTRSLSDPDDKSGAAAVIFEEKTKKPVDLNIENHLSVSPDGKFVAFSDYSKISNSGRVYLMEQLCSEQECIYKIFKSIDVGGSIENLVFDWKWQRYDENRLHIASRDASGKLRYYFLYYKRFTKAVIEAKVSKTPSSYENYFKAAVLNKAGVNTSSSGSSAIAQNLFLNKCQIATAERNGTFSYFDLRSAEKKQRPAPNFEQNYIDKFNTTWRTLAQNKKLYDDGPRKRAISEIDVQGGKDPITREFFSSDIVQMYSTVPVSIDKDARNNESKRVGDFKEFIAVTADGTIVNLSTSPNGGVSTNSGGQKAETTFPQDKYKVTASAISNNGNFVFCALKKIKNDEKTPEIVVTKVPLQTFIANQKSSCAGLDKTVYSREDTESGNTIYIQSLAEYFVDRLFVLFSFVPTQPGFAEGGAFAGYLVDPSQNKGIIKLAPSEFSPTGDSVIDISYSFTDMEKNVKMKAGFYAHTINFLGDRTTLGFTEEILGNSTIPQSPTKSRLALGNAQQPFKATTVATLIYPKFTPDNVTEPFLQVPPDSTIKLPEGLAIGNAKGEIRVSLNNKDLAAPKELGMLGMTFTIPTPDKETPPVITSISMSDDALMLAAGTLDGRIFVWYLGYDFDLSRVKRFNALTGYKP